MTPGDLSETQLSSVSTEPRQATHPRGSRGTWIYDQVREKIITGEYPQGMRMNETRISEELKVSRVPLRETFHALERDGFIEQRPRRSAVVTHWTVERVNELFDVRLGLEVEAAGLAASHRTAEGITRLYDNLELERCAQEDGLRVRAAQASVQLHVEIVKLTNNDLLTSLMNQIAHRMGWLFYLTSGRSSEQACAEHSELIQTIESGNVELAKVIAYAHIERGRLPSLEMMNLRLTGAD